LGFESENAVFPRYEKSSLGGLHKLFFENIFIDNANNFSHNGIGG
jgi:hypothetical protein